MVITSTEMKGQYLQDTLAGVYSKNFMEETEDLGVMG